MTEGTNVIDISDVGRKLASMRQIVKGNCEVCGKPFTGTRKKRYCSNRCRVAAFRAAHRQAEEGAQPK